MENEIIITLLGGGLIGALLTFIVGLLTHRYNYHHLFAEIISKSRNNWLNEFKDSISN